MATLDERVATLEAQLAALREANAEAHRAIQADVLNLRGDVHGPPFERSIRGRLHILEAAGAATRAAEAALETARAVQRQTWPRRRQLAAWAVGITAALGSVVTTVIAVVALAQS